MNENQNQIQEQQQTQIQEVKTNEMTFNGVSFDSLVRASTIFSKAKIIPTTYQDKPADCFIALEMAQRMNVAPMMVMQNLYMVNGRPAWSSQFIISQINTCGKFTPLQFEIGGTGDERYCIAYATFKATGERCESIKVDIKMAKDEGWYQKNGSKWKTMPDLMLRYRAASFFGKFYCPEKLMGIASQEEVIEIDPTDYTVENVVVKNEEQINEEIKVNANTGEVVEIKEEPKQEVKEQKNIFTDNPY